MCVSHRWVQWHREAGPGLRGQSLEACGCHLGRADPKLPGGSEESTLCRVYFLGSGGRTSLDNSKRKIVTIL